MRTFILAACLSVGFLGAKASANPKLNEGMQIPSGDASLVIQSEDGSSKAVPNARILKTSILVPQTGMTYIRYAFVVNVPAVEDSLITAVATVYVDPSSGNSFSYFWDTSVLRTSETIGSDGGEFNKNSWIQLAQTPASVAGTFYLGDPSSVKFTIGVKGQEVRIETSAIETNLVGIFQRWVKTVYTFTVK